MAFARRLAAVLVAVLLLVEGGGVARAFGAGAQVTCCCGRHAAARPCHCRSCPARHRDHRVHDEHGTGPILATGCANHAPDDAPLPVLATHAVEAPALDGPAVAGAAPRRPPTRLASRLADDARPPP